jgi:biopolymer transport protein ExbD
MSQVTEQTGLVGEVMGGLYRRARVWPGLRMTAMIDVIFLLLTFFVLTAQFDRPEQALPLVFGTDASASLKTPKTLHLVIAADGQGCAVKVGDGEAIIISNAVPESGLAALAERVQTAVSAEEGVGRPIYLNCGNAVSWELVTKVYDVLYGMGARDITFVVED